jgi:UDP-N-acetylmuramyl pentapeptide phosphotransferase/UDP-N-acetylglucosamine-1-phosphate transferase
MRLAWVGAAAIVLAALGLADDTTALGVTPRLLFQIIAVVIVVAALPGDLRIVPLLPWWLERLVLLMGSLWFVNAVNFMDGIDWITAAEVIPVAGGLALLGAFGALPPQAIIVALALCGAMVGFAPFNRPVAHLFLGDAGSLPIGLLLSWLLIILAGNGHIAAALLLPLYYLADTMITLLRRLAMGEAITSPHRQHYYQQALDGGFTVHQIVARIFILNIALTALALVTIVALSLMTQVVALVVGCGMVTALLVNFSRQASVRSSEEL